ncbi:hypothetical protein INR49_011691 [Caranx melampygus]|nr:hypothetical protein INR49_011691 [Caranx melampygus]
MAATTSRRLCFILSMMCLASFVNSMGVKEQLAHMRKQLVELQETLKTRAAEFEAERASIQEVIDGNIARVNCLKKSPSWSDPEVQEVVKTTERDSAHARRDKHNGLLFVTLLQF